MIVQLDIIVVLAFVGLLLAIFAGLLLVIVSVLIPNGWTIALASLTNKPLLCFHYADGNMWYERPRNKDDMFFTDKKGLMWINPEMWQKGESSRWKKIQVIDYFRNSSCGYGPAKVKGIPQAVKFVREYPDFFKYLNMVTEDKKVAKLLGCPDSELKNTAIRIVEVNTDGLDQSQARAALDAEAELLINDVGEAKKYLKGQRIDDGKILWQDFVNTMQFPFKPAIVKQIELTIKSIYAQMFGNAMGQYLPWMMIGIIAIIAGAVAFKIMGAW